MVDEPDDDIRDEDENEDERDDMDVQSITFVQTGKVQTIPYEEGMTITQAFRMLGVSVGRGQEIRLNNRSITDQDTILDAGDQLMIAGNIAGG